MCVSASLSRSSRNFRPRHLTTFVTVTKTLRWAGCVRERAAWSIQMHRLRRFLCRGKPHCFFPPQPGFEPDGALPRIPRNCTTPSAASRSRRRGWRRVSSLPGECTQERAGKTDGSDGAYSHNIWLGRVGRADLPGLPTSSGASDTLLSYCSKDSP